MVITQTSPPSIAQDITTTHFTPDEYRVMEETAVEKHEYRNGEIIAMAGGSEVHSRLTVNITTLLNLALRDTNFQTYNGDLRIWISEFNHGTYADVLVINGEPEFNGDACGERSYRTDEILNPLVIVEVLSPSTEGYDREALLQAVRWQWQVYDHIDQSILVHSLNVEVPLGEVYRRINF